MLLMVLLCGPVACVERTITVTSEPAGALLHLNEREVGRTPVTVPFTHYGTYDVRLQADGHRPLWTRAEAKTPLWDLPGPDLFAEMIPDARSEINWHFDLEKLPPPDREALLKHSRQMKALLDQETALPEKEVPEAEE